METLFIAFKYYLGMAIIIIPFELSFRILEYPILRKEWITDSFFYFGQAILWNSVTLVTLNYIFRFIHIESLIFIQEGFAKFPFWIQVGVVILLSDLFIYWGHRFQHTYDFLWRFHKVHHTAEIVDYLAAFREHPLDNIYTRGLETLPSVLLGLDINLIAGFITFRGLWGLFIHSNVQFRFGFLEKLLGSPHLHHWHHELEKRGRCNYANLSPLMDIAFGTYYSPIEPSKNFGINDKFTRSYIGQILEPLIPDRILIYLDKKKIF